MSKQTKMLTVNLPQEMFDQFKDGCQKDGMKMSDVIKSLISSYLKGDMEAIDDNIVGSDSGTKKIEEMIDQKFNDYLDKNIENYIDNMVASKIDIYLEKYLDKFYDRAKEGKSDTEQNLDSDIDSDTEENLESSIDKNLDNDTENNDSEVGENDQDSGDLKTEATEEEIQEIVSEIPDQYENAKNEERANMIAKTLKQKGFKIADKLGHNHLSYWNRDKRIPQDPNKNHYLAYQVWKRLKK